MAQTTLSVRMDEDVKKGLEAFCADVGMNTSVAINMFAKAVLRERRLPFEVVSYNLDPFYSQANQERLAKSIKQMERSGGTEREIVIHPVRDQGGEVFSEQILADLIAQGYSGDELLVAFRKTRAQVRPAVEAMLEEAERAATQPDKYASYADVFGTEDDE